MDSAWRLGADVPASAAGFIERCATQPPGSPQQVAARAPPPRPPTPLADVTLLPCVPRPGKIICLGRELRRPCQGRRQYRGRLPGAVPALQHLAAGASARRCACRRISSKLDYEAELAVVIGRRTRFVQRGRCAGSRLRLRLLQRRHAARLPAPHHAMDDRQELRRHRRLRPLPGHGRRTAARVHGPAHRVPPERPGDAERHHLGHGVRRGAHDLAAVRVPDARARRRGGDGHAGRRGLCAHAAGVDEGRRHDRDRDRRASASSPTR